METSTSEIIGEYQFSFRKGKWTSDYIFTVQSMMGKYYEFDKDLYMIFIGFKQTYDIVNRNQIIKHCCVCMRDMDKNVMWWTKSYNIWKKNPKENKWCRIKSGIKKLQKEKKWRNRKNFQQTNSTNISKS
jgi:hypothetical protein